MANLLRVVLAAFLLTSCSAVPTLAPNEYVMTFTSQPSGALIYTDSGKAIGTTPYRGTVKLSSETMAQDSIVSAFTVVWPSGAKLTQSKRWSPKTNRRWTFGFDRPVAAPNLDVDLRHALAVEGLAEQKREAVAAANREAARAFLEGLAASQKSRSTSCLGVMMGKDAFTMSCR